MRRLVIIITLCVGCLTAVNAQTTFTERLQKSVAGQGRVTVTHDASIDALVNGPKVAIQQQENKEQLVATAPVERLTTEKADASDRPESSKSQQLMPVTPEEDDTEPTMTENRKKVMLNSVKVTGYRVQAFAGGNSRQDPLKAERTASTIKANYPTVPVYTHFYSPRWLCRVGNYRTYEEAEEMLRNIKKLGFKSATIVKGKITVRN